MIMLTKEQLADLLRESYSKGVADGYKNPGAWLHSEVFHAARERAIQPLVHRWSGGHDDHGREVVTEASVAKLVLPTPEQVMHVVMKFQWEDRKNGTGTTNWAANLGMTVVEYVARLNADHGREVK